MSNVLTFELLIDDEPQALEGSLTLGRHLDNDVIIAGEDVLDYHARVAIEERAIRVHPLLDATVLLNGQPFDQTIGIVPGDELRIGASTLELRCYTESHSVPPSWTLVAPSGDAVLELSDTHTVGRGDDAALKLDDDHISRQHAQLRLNGLPWVVDLGSANGTFVNGERVAGGVWLYHGDLLTFDTHQFQLIGIDAELTPVRPASSRDLAPIESLDTPELPNDTTVIGAVDLEAAVTSPTLPPDDNLIRDAGAGSFLIGASEPLENTIFRPTMGRTLLGRAADCDLVIADPTVSLHHAEIMTRPEGTTITNLMATNGTRVNGERIQGHQLQDGDILRLGQVSLVYKNISVSPQDQQLMRRIAIGLLAGSALLALALLILD